MGNKRVVKKQQFNINNLLFLLIIVAILGILYMLYEDKINSYFVKETPKQEEIEVTVLPTKKVEEVPYDNTWYLNNASQYKKYTLTSEYVVNVSEPLTKLRVRVPIAQHQKNLQYVFNVTSIPQATSEFIDDENKYFIYEIENVQPKQYKFYVENQVALKKYDINNAKKENLNLRPEVNLEKYLKSEENIDVNSEYLNRVANNIQGFTKEEIVKNIYNFVQENVEYTLNTKNVGAEEVLRNKKGFCAGFSALMVTLCRIKNIPARIVAGNLVINGKNSKHNWVEVYYSEYGWVLYDPTFFVVDKANRKVMQKEKLRTPDKDYLVLGHNIIESWGVEIESDKEIFNPISLDYNFKIMNN